MKIKAKLNCEGLSVSNAQLQMYCAARFCRIGVSSSSTLLGLPSVRKVLMIFVTFYGERTIAVKGLLNTDALPPYSSWLYPSKV